MYTCYSAIVAVHTATALQSCKLGSASSCAPSCLPRAVLTCCTSRLHLPPPLQGVRMIVTLECTEARAEGATPSRYTTQKVRATACCG